MTELGKNQLYRDAVEDFARDLSRLDEATARAVAAEAREMVRAALLRQEIAKGRASGTPIDEADVFDELLSEARSDVERAR